MVAGLRGFRRMVLEEDLPRAKTVKNRQIFQGETICFLINKWRCRCCRKPKLDIFIVLTHAMYVPRLVGTRPGVAGVGAGAAVALALVQSRSRRPRKTQQRPPGNSGRVGSCRLRGFRPRSACCKSGSLQPNRAALGGRSARRRAL